MNIKLGKIVKPQALKGEMKVFPYIKDLCTFEKLKLCFIANNTYKINKVRNATNGLFITLEGIDSIEKAELMRGAEIEITKDKLPKLSDDEFYIMDIIGSEIIFEDKVIGTLSEVYQNGSADVYCVKGEKNFMIPAIKRVIKNINIEEMKIYLEPTYTEAVVYED